jgi:hypothetical protein
MKYISKIVLTLIIFGCIATLIVGSVHNIDFGTWGLVAIVGFMALCLVLVALPWLTKKFNIEYTKKDGLKITEEK